MATELRFPRSIADIAAEEYGMEVTLYRSATSDVMWIYDDVTGRRVRVAGMDMYVSARLTELARATIRRLRAMRRLGPRVRQWRGICAT